MDLTGLHVITMVSNPVRYKSRYRLYEQFQAHMKHSGVDLWTCEIAYGDRPFAITSPHNPRHLQLRTRSEVWHKENALNLLMARLPSDWKYVAWVDADIEFVRKDWPLETVHQLQHHQVVQMWRRAIDLSPTGDAIATYRSFAELYLENSFDDRTADYHYAHPGFAWAARREALEATGLLLDFAILGAADFYMAWAWIGDLDRYLLKDKYKGQTYSPNYVAWIKTWQDNAKKLRKDVGVVDGTVFHHWHGKKRNRFYQSRKNILIADQFDPLLDLGRDAQGLYHLMPRSIRLRDDLRQYFRDRNEDDNTLE